MKKILAAIALFSAAVSSHAGPFGLTFGDSYAKLAKLGLTKDRTSQWYTVKSVPNPHRDFDEYKVLISPKFGLCKIVAFVNRVPTDVFGGGLKDQFETLEKALSKKYGEGNKYDYLKSGSIWDEPKDFMMALFKDERTLATYWVDIDPSTHDGVTAVGLKADARSTSIGIFGLSYESQHTRECVTASKDETNSSL